MKSLFKSVKGGTVALTLIAAAAAAVAAPSPQLVQVQESGIPGAAANSIAVDQLSGQYDEVLTVHPGVAPNYFSTEAVFYAGGWFKNGAPVGSQVNAPALFAPAGYGLYAKFTGWGVFMPNAGGGFTFQGQNGYLELWADPGQDTTYSVAAAATQNPSVNNLILTSGAGSDGDDIMLGSASAVDPGSAGNTAPGVANGNFEIIFTNWQLTAAGQSYFVAPAPDFYTQLDLNGNFQAFNPTSLTSIQLLQSSANAFFFSNTVPEPGALGLLGLALAAVGAVSRRRQAR